MTVVTGERTDAGLEPRRTGKGWHRDDVTLLIGSLLSSAALTWLAIYQLLLTRKCIKAQAILLLKDIPIILLLNPLI